jgi:aspartyl-tRNA(Asn)/glutamyl-tRNA(Gln) amidotransferase subunit C
MIDRAEVLHVARLARLTLDEHELERMTRELGGVLEHIATIEQLDLDDVEPTTHVVAVANALRPDTPEASLPRAVVLGAAPAPDGDGFGVPSPQA